MARTYRNTKPSHRAAREARYAEFDALPEGAYLPWDPPARHRGGMVMSHRPSGIWDDCRPDDGPSRKAQRRALKRRERRIALAEAWAEVGP